MSQDIDEIINDLLKIDINDLDKQWKACIKLNQIKDDNNKEKIVNAVLQVLKLNSVAITRAHAIETLGNICSSADTEVIEKIREFMNDDYRLVRAYAIKALGQLTDFKSIEKLIEKLENDDFFGVRAESAKSIGIICNDPKFSSHDNCIKAKIKLKIARENEPKKIVLDNRAMRVYMEAKDAHNKIELDSERMKKYIVELKKLWGRETALSEETKQIALENLDKIDQIRGSMKNKASGMGAFFSLTSINL
jgi:HEAT repeats